MRKITYSSSLDYRADYDIVKQFTIRVATGDLYQVRATLRALEKKRKPVLLMWKFDYDLNISQIREGGYEVLICRPHQEKTHRQVAELIPPRSSWVYPSATGLLLIKECKEVKELFAETPDTEIFGTVPCLGAVHASVDGIRAAPYLRYPSFEREKQSLDFHIEMLLWHDSELLPAEHCIFFRRIE